MTEQKPGFSRPVRFVRWSARRALAALGPERVEQVAGWTLYESLGYRLTRLTTNDVHEARHLRAQLDTGNSEQCETGLCRLDVEARDRWVAQMLRDEFTGAPVPRSGR